jgi:uncharacterized protein YdcH (DUF465 family)
MIENHSLANELPEYKEAIHDLKMSDRHFQVLFNDYHKVDKEIHRIEEGIENTSDAYLDGLKKTRLSLKDELFKMLKSAEAEA